MSSAGLEYYEKEKGKICQQEPPGKTLTTTEKHNSGKYNTLTYCLKRGGQMGTVLDYKCFQHVPSNSIISNDECVDEIFSHHVG